MQLVTYVAAGEHHIAVKKAQSLYRLEDLDPTLPRTMNELLSALPQLVQRQAELLHNAEPLAERVQLAPPVPNPETNACSGSSPMSAMISLAVVRV